MIDLGEIVPTATLGPQRTSSGTALGRFTTTDEQRQEVIERMTLGATEHKVQAIRATAMWARGEPTILEVSFVVEHVNGRRVWLADKVTELMPNGAEIQYSEANRLRVMNEELIGLRENGML